MAARRGVKLFFLIIERDISKARDVTYPQVCVGFVTSGLSELSDLIGKYSCYI